MHAKSLQDSLWPYELKGFFRQEYWSGLPCPPPGDLPDPGIKPTSLTSPALAGVFFTRSSVWEGLLVQYYYLTCSSYSNFTNCLNNVFSSPRSNQNHIFICHISDNHFLREYFSKKKKEKRKIQIKKSDYLHIHSAYCHYHLFTNSQICHSPVSSSILDLCFLPSFPVVITVGMNVLAEALKNINNAENCQVLIRPYSKVIIRFPIVMMKHGSFRFSHSVVSDSLWPQGLQHARPPLSISNSWSLLKLMSIQSVISFQPSHPLSSPSPPFNLVQHQGLF